MSNINWRSISPQRSKEFEPLVDKLVTSEGALFRNIKDLMVFAALVGLENGQFKPIESKEKVGISLDTYSTTDDDAFIYFLALHKHQNIATLEDENLGQSIKIFEGYCHAGLGIIESWFSSTMTSDDATEVLFNRIYDQLVK